MAAEQPRRTRADKRAARERQRRNWKRSQTWQRLLALEIIRRWDVARSAEAIAAVESIVTAAAEQLERIETRAPRSWIVPGARPAPRQRLSTQTCSGLHLVPPMMMPPPPCGEAFPRIQHV